MEKDAGLGAGSGSFSARLALGLQLKAHREAAHKTHGDFAVAKIGSPSKNKRIEAGKSPVKVLDVRAMCELYGVDKTTTEQLERLAEHTNDHGWWEPYGDFLPKWLATLVSIEVAARTIWTWDPEVVHGLLQTTAYQRAVFKMHPQATAEYVDQQVKFRSDRQRAAFDRTPPLHLEVVIGEGALHRQVGGPEVMAEQFQHLLKLSEEAHIDIDVLTFAAGAHVAMAGAFTTVELYEPAARDVVYLETHAGGMYDEDVKTTTEYHALFTAIKAMSTPIQEYKP